MKIGIIGSKGMLGCDLSALCLRRGIEISAFDLPELDICNPASVEQLEGFDWLINCAAYTNVDGAETEQELSYAINANGPGILGRWCHEHDCGLLHISTDYVFDGELDAALTEEMPCNPINVYGASKLAGEDAVRESACRHLIVRTQSLFGIHGKNFIKAITARLEQGQPLRVVDDQISSPTWTVHLAEGLLSLINCGKAGTVHLSSEGACSWHEFAEAIAEAQGYEAEIVAVPSSEYPTPAARPAHSVLSKARYTDWTGQVMPRWEDALKGYLAIPE